jgi:hypothetical protein
LYDVQIGGYPDVLLATKYKSFAPPLLKNLIFAASKQKCARMATYKKVKTGACSEDFYG